MNPKTVAVALGGPKLQEFLATYASSIALAQMIADVESTEDPASQGFDELHRLFLEENGADMVNLRDTLANLDDFEFAVEEPVRRRRQWGGCAMKVRLVASSRKPLEEYTAEDRRALRAPSVEDHLNAIRGALALTIAVNLATQHEYAEEIEDIIADATEAAGQQVERAWQQVRELKNGFSGEIQNLHVIVDEAGGVQ